MSSGEHWMQNGKGRKLGMEKRRTITGLAKVWLYCRIALHVAGHYLIRPRHFNRNPLRYLRFLWRALRLLLIFRHNKAICRGHLVKLHLYLPAYPSRAFFRSIETKLIRQPAGPVTVVYSMTRACTYHCPHCYQKRDQGADLEEQVLLDTALRVRDAGVTMFDIEGGEPLLRFPRLLRLVQALGDTTECWVNTTGAGLRPGMLPELRQAGAYGLMVSIHSPDPGTHDAFTGVDGSFEVAAEVIRQARSEGLAAVINSVQDEAELRAGRLHDLMELARSLDCDFVQLIHPKPAGLWLEKEGMQADPSLIEAVRGDHVLYNSRDRSDYPSLAAQVFEEAPHVLGCTAGGIDRFYIGADGEVQPCEFLNLSFGNVTAEPFEQIFARMRAAFPDARCDWLCCTQAGAIAAALAASGSDRTPLAEKPTAELVASWNRGDATPVYEKLGIYHP